jgi:hypothetical protein
VLASLLYAIYESPLFDISPILSFARYSSDVKANKIMSLLVKDLKKISLETVTKWLKKYVLKVNNKTKDVCLFYKHETAPVSAKLGDATII